MTSVTDEELIAAVRQGRRLRNADKPTLRDQFAMAAPLETIIDHVSWTRADMTFTMDELASISFRWANSCMKAREAK